MKVQWINEKKQKIIGTVTYQNEELNFFKDTYLVIILKKAAVEYITPSGFLINGFEEYDSKNDRYEYKRYYFHFMEDKD